jgi:hypothetical protein
LHLDAVDRGAHRNVAAAYPRESVPEPLRSVAPTSRPRGAMM